MRNVTDTLRIHLDLSFQMLTKVIELCPESLWYGTEEKKSIWKRILHVLESIDYRLTDFAEYDFNDLFHGISAEMDQSSVSSVTKNKMIRYRGLMEEKLKILFEQTDDQTLLRNSSRHPGATCLDIILSQIRHIQINLGYCNEMFSNKGIKSPEWTGYNEKSRNRSDGNGTEQY